MKNPAIQIPFDEAKLKALRQALKKKELSVEGEVARFVTGLYTRNVPKQVQDFLDEIAADEG